MDNYGNLRSNYNILDLFSGAGGMSEGFMQAGFRVPFANEYSKEAALTYINRHKQLGYNSEMYNGDIKELLKNNNLLEFINDKEIDVVIGGPPCQGFSLSGKREQADPRNELFLDFLKVIKIVKPKYFVMENVEGFLSFRFNKIEGISKEIYENKLVSEIIQNEAKKIGYFVKYEVLNAKDYGVPQNRSRVIFLGHQVKWVNSKKIDLVVPPNFPTKSDKIVTVSEAISDLRFLKNGEKKEKYDLRYKPTEYQLMLRKGLTPNIHENFIDSGNKLTNHQASKHNNNTVERFKLLYQGESISELLFRLDENDQEHLFTKKFRCTKLHPNEVSPTVLTLPDDIVHYEPNNPRILTVREMARLQSFDDSFQFLGKRTTGGDRRKVETPQYTQVGNAVPPLFAKAIANEILKALKEMNRLKINNFSKKI